MNYSLITKLLLEINKVFERSARSSNKQAVIVLGNTGAGKSTLINNLLGHPLKQEFNDKTGDEYIVLEKVKALLPSEYAKIGHSGSETTIPQAFTLPNGDLIFDMPGFNDTRACGEFDIALYLAIQILVKSGIIIKNIIVLMDERELTVSRGRELWGLANTLSQMISAELIDEFSKTNMIFGLTKCSGKRDEEQLKNLVENLYNSKISDLSKNVDPSSSVPIISSKDREIIQFMESMKNSMVMKIDVLEGKACSDKIFDYLKKSTIKSQEFFAMTKNKVYYNDLLHCTSEISKMYMEFSDKRDNCKADLLEIERKISLLEVQISDLKCIKDSGDACHDTFKTRTVDFFKDKILTLDQDISVLHQKLIESKEQSIKTKREYDNHQNRGNEVIDVFSDSYCERKKYGYVKPGVINEYEIKYDGPAYMLDYTYTKKVSYGQEGRLVQINRDTSVLEYKYYTPSHFYGSIVKFVVKALSVQLPSFKNKTTVLRSRYLRDLEKISNIEEQIKNKELEKKASQENLSSEINAIRAGIEREISEKSSELSELQSSLVFINRNLKEIEEELSTDKRVEEFEFLCTIGKHISFQEDMIESDFLKKYLQDKCYVGQEHDMSIAESARPIIFSSMTIGENRDSRVFNELCQPDFFREITFPVTTVYGI